MIGALAALWRRSPCLRPRSAAAKPDLTVSALKLAGTQLSGTVKNAGKGKAGKSTLTVTNGKTKLATITVKALAKGKSATFKATIKPPAPRAATRCRPAPTRPRRSRRARRPTTAGR